MKVVLVLLGAVALLAAGCGGSSKDATETTVVTQTVTESTDTTATDTSSSADTSTESTDTSTTDTSTDSSTTSTVSDDLANAAGLSEGCKKVANLSIEFSSAIAAASGSGSQDMEATAKAFENFANQVPDEIRQQFKVIAAAFAKYVQVIKDLDLAPGKTPSASDIAKLTKASQELDNAQVKAANASVTKWANDNCAGK